MSAILERLIAQGAGEGAALVTLKAIVEEASEAGAVRALARLGLHDEAAGTDIIELRQLIQGWRDAKRSAAREAVQWLVRAVVAVLLIGLAVKLGMLGTIRAGAL